MNIHERQENSGVEPTNSNKNECRERSGFGNIKIGLVWLL